MFVLAAVAGLVPYEAGTSSVQLLNRRPVLLGITVAAIPHAVTAVDDVSKARVQMESSVSALDDLLKRYDTIAKDDGGNGVRRVLGKLGPTSPLHRVDKAVNLVARDLEDERAFELADDFLRQIDSADGNAYSSIFVPTGGGTTPEYWLDKSRKDVALARATLDRFLALE